MKRWTIVAALVALLVPAAGFAWWHNIQVKPREFDPGKTFLVQAEWLSGIGCPTNARIANPNADFTGVGSIGSYTDPACPTGDSRDRKHQGLILAKTGPTENFAAAVADIKGVKGKTLTELGYDIRKPGTSFADPRGSWCGAGAPRFNIETTAAFYFLGCASPPPTMEQDGDGFIRLTWGGTLPLMAFGPLGLQPVMGTVKSLQIVFDEGTTHRPVPSGPNVELGFGLAVLDNINVNGVRVGRGSSSHDDDEDDERRERGKGPRHCDHCDDD